MEKDSNLQRQDPAASDGLVITRQLQRYRQRDLTPSHLYRLGTKLFRSEPTRHRVIEASRYVPRELVPHAANLRRTWDGKPLDSARARSQKPLLQRRHSEQSLIHVKTSDFTEEHYRQWMEERRSVRAGLDGMAVSERWLSTKTRTPLENKLLAELRYKKKAAMTTQIPVTRSQEDTVISLSSMAKNDSASRLSRQKYRRSMIKEAEALASQLLHGKQRFITLLALHDPTGEGSISAVELDQVIHKMRPVVRQETLDIILESLPTVEGGKLDYRPLVRGDVVQCIRSYLDAKESSTSDHSVSVTEKSTQSIVLQQNSAAESDTTQTTMGGERGTLSTAYKEEEQRQFEALLQFCRETGIILNKELAEKALLLPPDHPRESCLAALRQPGLDLLSEEFTAPPREAAKAVEKRDVGRKFGWAYKELKGKRKPRYIRIPKLPEQTAKSLDESASRKEAMKVKKATLKKVLVVPKVDCWLTFKEYQKFTRELTSRSGFNYKYHGLPGNNAFWPGALVDKLRLWLPNETLADKPYSLYNIFQPVTHPQIYNPHIPNVEQRRAWPENAQGYVQFGGDSRKSFAL